MLEELSKFEHLGSPEYYLSLAALVSTSPQPWTIASLEKHYYGKHIGGSSIFDGCIDLALRSGVLTTDKSGVVAINDELANPVVSNKYLQTKILEKILICLQSDEVFFEIFCPENLSYDIVYRTIQISNSAFGFKYSNVKQLLINFAFLKRHPDVHVKVLIVDSVFKKMFDQQILPEVKKRKVGIEELERSLAQKQIYGDEAEDFTLAYEKSRMSVHVQKKLIEKISAYDVSAGYDIVSFDSVHSIKIDRFIEVKSYSKSPAFYWSRNEIEQARIKREAYYLYLVDREKMNSEGYKPLVIKDPYSAVYTSSQWDKAPSVTYVTKVG